MDCGVHFLLFFCWHFTSNWDLHASLPPTLKTPLAFYSPTWNYVHRRRKKPEYKFTQHLGKTSNQKLRTVSSGAQLKLICFKLQYIIISARLKNVVTNHSIWLMNELLIGQRSALLIFHKSAKNIQIHLARRQHFNEIKRDEVKVCWTSVFPRPTYVTSGVRIKLRLWFRSRQGGFEIVSGKLHYLRSPPLR
jgi:hypothetical protein